MTTATSAKTIADLLREHRMNKGFTQEALARSAGISISSVARTETGAIPKLEVLYKLAAALHVDVRDLIPGSPDVNLPEVHGDAPPGQ